MHLTVNHVTHFKFGEPATHSIQYIRMTPRADLCQRVRNWDISASGRLTPWTDGFDNHAHVATYDGEHDEVRVTVTGEITTSDTNGILPMDDGLPPYIFLTPTDYTDSDAEIEKFAKPIGKVLAAEGALAAGLDRPGLARARAVRRPGRRRLCDGPALLAHGAALPERPALDVKVILAPPCIFH